MTVGEEGTADDIAALIRKENADRRRRVRDLVRLASDGDAEGFFAALASAYNNYELDAGLRAIGRLSSVPAIIRDVSLAVWLQYGDGWRNRAGSDRALIRALRVLLPPYEGPAVQLYRGDGAWNRRCRTYGLSWTASREVAEDFAQREWQFGEGGSVVLESMAPPEAVICAPHEHGDRYGEVEYLVDRTRLGAVTVVARFPQKAHIRP